MQATVGQLLVNSALPEDMQDYARVWDKKTTQRVMDELAKRHPDKYRDVVFKLHEVGGLASYTMAHSVSLEHVRNQTMSDVDADSLRAAMDKINSSKAQLRDKHNQILELLGGVVKTQESNTLRTLSGLNNPLALEVQSGSRGNATQLNSMVGSPVLMLDQNDNPIPVPVISSFSEGLTPAEYWATTYGTRKGAVATKMATADSGFLGKQLALAAHRLIATDDVLTPGLGLPVGSNDPDNVGSVLAQDVGPYKAGTVITHNMIHGWPKGTNRILVRSPISDIAANGGVPREAAGVRERGELPYPGDQLGITAVQTLSEALSQGSLNSKHTGGAGGVRKGGFDVINQLLQVPSVFPDGAAHAMEDGTVSEITDADRGGKFVHIGEHKYYVSPEQAATVKVNDTVEAGDVLSNGLPNPAVITANKGIGEGRKYFADLMRATLGDSGITTNRRNIELLARSVINHVEVDDETDAIPGALPGDVMEYDYLASHYIPRKGAVQVPVKSARGQYLERPVLHYSIGTRLTPSVVNTMAEFNVNNVVVHKDAPPFRPYQNRIMTSLLNTPDWLTRLGSFYVQKGLLDSVHRAGTSDLNGPSYIPRLVTGQPLRASTPPKFKGLANSSGGATDDADDNDTWKAASVTGDDLSVDYLNRHEPGLLDARNQVLEHGGVGGPVRVSYRGTLNPDYVKATLGPARAYRESEGVRENPWPWRIGGGLLGAGAGALIGALSTEEGGDRWANGVLGAVGGLGLGVLGGSAVAEIKSRRFLQSLDDEKLDRKIPVSVGKPELEGYHGTYNPLLRRVVLDPGAGGSGPRAMKFPDNMWLEAVQHELLHSTQPMMDNAPNRKFETLRHPLIPAKDSAAYLQSPKEVEAYSAQFKRNHFALGNKPLVTPELARKALDEYFADTTGEGLMGRMTTQFPDNPPRDVNVFFNAIRDVPAGPRRDAILDELSKIIPGLVKAPANDATKIGGTLP